MKRLRLSLILLMLTIALVACGGDGDDNNDDSESSSNDDNSAQIADENSENELSSNFNMVDLSPMTTIGVGKVQTMTLSPDDSQVAIGTSISTVHLYDTSDLTAEPTLIENVGRGAVTDLAYSPDGSQLVVTNYSGTVHMIDLATSDIIWEVTPERTSSSSLLDDLSIIPAQVTYSPDGTLVAVGYDDYGSVTLFDASTGDEARLLEGRTAYTNLPHLTFNSDGSQLFASHGNQDIEVFDVATGELINRLEDYRPIYALDINADDSLLATVTRTDNGATVVSMLNTSDFSVSSEVLFDNFGDALLFAPDENFLITARDSGQIRIVRVVDITNETLLAQFPTRRHVNDLALSSDGNTLYITDESGLYVIDAQALLAGDEETIIEETLATVDFGGAMTGVDFSDDLSQVLICTNGGQAMVYDFATSDLLHTVDLPEAYGCSVRYMPDENNIIAKVGTDGYALDLESGEVLFSFRFSNGAGISADGTTALGAFSADLDIFDLATAPHDGDRIDPALEVDFEALVGYERLSRDVMALNADGSRGIARGTVTNTYPVAVFDTATGDIITEIEAWTEVIRMFSFSDDGNTLALVGYEDLGLDGNRIIAQVHDVSGAEAILLAEIPISDPNNEDLRVRSVAINGNGSLVALQADDNIIHLWDREAGEIIASFDSGLTHWGLRFIPNTAYLVGFDYNTGGVLIDEWMHGVTRVWDLSDYVSDRSTAPSSEATAEATQDTE